MLTKDQMLAASDIGTSTCTVPEWGGDVLLKDLSALQREEVEVRYAKHEKTGTGESLKGLKVLVAAYTLIGDDGQRLFVKPDEVEKLGEKSGKAIDRIFMHVMKHNGMTKEAASDLAKN